MFCFSLKSYRCISFAMYFLCGFLLNSYAGYRGDRFVVWVNLEGDFDHYKINEAVVDFINSGRVDSACGVHWEGEGSTLYMKRRPDGITDELVEKVFIEKNKASLRRLNDLLRSFRDVKKGIGDGLDGIMVYSNKNGAHMMNFITGRKKIKIYPMTLVGFAPTVKDIEEAFCILLPPTTRAP